MYGLATLESSLRNEYEWIPCNKTNPLPEGKKKKKKSPNGINLNLHKLQWRPVQMEEGIKGNFALLNVGPESPSAALHYYFSWRLPAWTPSPPPTPRTHLRLNTQQVLSQDP